MIDMRTVPEDEIGPLQKYVKGGINTVKSWIKPMGIGRFGLSFNWGGKEIFVGVSVAKLLTETVVHRRDKRVIVRSGESKVFDL